jgi:LmeA-like phospholipid-binding
MRRISAIATAGVILLLLVLAQLFLPGIAQQRLHDQLARSGRVLEVKVSAFPAIKLLWHNADHVVIRMGTYRATPGQLGSQLGQAGDVGTLDASATEVDSGLLTVRDATLHKRGNQLTGSALVTEPDLRTALPILQSVEPVASSNGQLTLRGTATLLGVSATVDATVAAVDGQLIVQPNVPFGALATVTVFSIPDVYVESVAASPASTGFTVYVRARLR